jgi:hypothetical protein
MIFSIFKRKTQEEVREETIKQMRKEEMEEFKQLLRDIRLSNLTEKEKEEQRKIVQEKHFHNLSIIK